MALTVLGYISAIEQRQYRIAPLLGTFLQGAPNEIRIALTLSNVMSAILMSVLVTKGITTDAELAGLFDNAVNQAFTPVPPPAPSGPPDPH